MGNRLADILKQPSIYIELGSGGCKGRNGWITLDISEGCDIQADLIEGLPFPDESVDKIYSEHFLEHFCTADIERILSECYRVLKKRGTVSTCVPDASIYINAYVNKETLDPVKWLNYAETERVHTSIDYVNYIAYMAGIHKHMFDRENLIAFFKHAGFVNVRDREFDPHRDKERRKHQSIYIEATKENE